MRIALWRYDEKKTEQSEGITLNSKSIEILKEKDMYKETINT